MIGRLVGTVVERHADGPCVLDVAGVGYEVLVPARVQALLPVPPATATLHVHTHVREDALTLYGFEKREDRAVFRVLLGISGIGPRIALGILGEMTTSELSDAVARGDSRRLQKLEGVGKKTAARLALELRDKLPLAGANGHNGKAAPAPAAPIPQTDVALATVDALMRLGFGRSQAEGAVSQVSAPDEQGPVEDLVRRALATL